MNRIHPKTRTISTLILVVATLLGLGFFWAGEAQAATLPTETCTYDGGTNTRTCELWAVAGTVDLPGSAGMPIWGYTDTDPGLGGVAQLPGPALIANQGEIVQVILHNNLGEATGLFFQGQAIPPDLVGVAAGGSTTYSFTASQPGTFLYEAALLLNAQHQTAMGMFGAFVVRPLGAPGQAYADAATAFNDEALVVLSEIDPALNNSANPAAFDMRDYAPKYWLISGKAYPDVDEIPSAAGNNVLLRYINAGLQPHTMNLLGLDQALLGVDGSALPYYRKVVANTIAPGQTADTLVTMPGTVPAGGGNYALYDGSFLTHNSGAAGFGGMMAFITLADGTVPPTGPTTVSVAVSPNPTDGSVAVAIEATIPGATSAEYFIDVQGGDGTGLSLSSGGPDLWTGTISTADLLLLGTGDHTIYVHGSDGVWGSFNFDVLHLDLDGPTTKGLVLSPNPSNGSVPVALSATGDDTAYGNSNIMAAEYFVDAQGADGTGEPMTVNQTAPIASLTATIPSGLVEGTHTVYVHSQDAFGHWGPAATIDLIVTQTGPTTSVVTVAPSPNNGTLPINPNQPSVRVDATITTVAPSTVKAAEGFIDTVGTDGTGFPMTPRDGLFNSALEKAYAFIPLTTINTLSEGLHQIWVHGKDNSGNWGAAVAGELFIDKTAPAVSGVAADPNPAEGPTTLTATATDASSNIAMAEWFEGADPGNGNGTPMQAADGAFDNLVEGLTGTIDVTLWAPGDHTLSVRARDAAGNWSAVETYVLTVQKPDAIFADSFVSGDLTAWNGGVVGPASASPAAAMDGDGFGMAATMTGITPGYVTDITPVLDPSYHARFYFNSNGALTGQNQAYTIFAGLDAANATIFRVQFRRQNQGGGTWQIRASALSGGTFANTGWFTIADGAPHSIEIAWASGASTSFGLYIDGTLVQTLTGLDTSANLLDAVRLGPSAGLTVDASGTLYFDAFVSTRYTVIGP